MTTMATSKLARSKELSKADLQSRTAGNKIQIYTGHI